MAHAGRVSEFDETPLDDAPLWRTSNPQFGLVRVVVVDGEYAIVLDDLNSDYREVELRAYRRHGQHWREIFSQDDAGFPSVGDAHGGGWCASPSDEGGYGWTFGRERAGAVVHLQFQGEPLDVKVNPEGWWLCVRATADQQFDAPSKVGITV